MFYQLYFYKRMEFKNWKLLTNGESIPNHWTIALASEPLTQEIFEFHKSEMYDFHIKESWTIKQKVIWERSK